MPPVPQRDVAADKLAHTYVAAWSRIEAELGHLIEDPLTWRRRARLAELAALVEKMAGELDGAARAWVQKELPTIYAAGAVQMANAIQAAQQTTQSHRRDMAPGSTRATRTAAGRSATWSMPHREAIQEVASTTYDLLLESTKHMKVTTKELIRAVTHDEVLQKLTTGTTAKKLGQTIAKRLVAEHGIAGVTYKNGARHTIGDYGEMVARTQSALAYNKGSLVQAREDGVSHVEVFDGENCGWTSHDDTDHANGSVRTVEEADAFSIAHPRCLRSFGPRPDLTKANAQDVVSPPSTATLPPAPARVPAAQTDHAAAVAQAKTGNRANIDGRAPFVKSTAPLSAAERHAAEVDTIVTRELNEHGDTLRRFTDDRGRWDPERQAMHDRIVQEIIDEHPHVPNDRQAVFMGGLPAAGKSTMLKASGNIDISKFVQINPEDMKERLAAHGALPDVAGLKPNEMAALIHEESSKLAYQLADRLTATGTNLAWDITMSSEKQVLARLEPLTSARRAPSYEVTGVFVDVPLATSTQRAFKRYESQWETPAGGRWVPPSEIAARRDDQWGSSNRRAFELVKDRFDRWELWDNGSGTPRRLATSL